MVGIQRNTEPGPGRLVVIDADVRAARAAHGLGRPLVFVQRPGSRADELVDDFSGYYTVDFAGEGFAEFVGEILAPLAPTAVVSLSEEGARAATLANSLLGTDATRVDEARRLLADASAGEVYEESGAAGETGAAGEAGEAEGRGERAASSSGRPVALFINNHPYSNFNRGGVYTLPTSEIDIHMAARTQIDGGVTGFADHPLDHVALCEANEEDRWREICSWILRNHPISRVIAVHERAVLLAAEMRSKFGLAGMDLDTATRFRDKVRMKDAVRAADAATVPDFAPLDTVEDLEKVDWSTGRKVIKSRTGLAAKDLYIVETLEEARRVVGGLDLSGSHYEVEEFVKGQIYHCDSVVRDGGIVFSSVGKYLADPASYRPGSIFGTVLVGESELVRRITALNTRVLAALGLKDGTTHLELFHTEADELVFCEVAGRPPGGIIPPVIQAQYGFDIVEAQIRIDAGLDVSLGTAPEPVDGTGTAGFLAFYPGGGESRGIDPDRLSALGVVEHLTHRGAGNGRGGVRHSTDFLDSYVIKAADDEELTRRIAAIQDEYWR
ncbi:acetyl-CoA carboxylase biotin carboxylase subunit family protein [Streptomyces sp. NPDC060184]|uniref:ATP-grasp domain-containing protein n=1 Tax=Streptomyces sp. NPDC060184 TaxID=3347064 RepID=UPI0036686EA5